MRVEFNKAVSSVTNNSDIINFLKSYKLTTNPITKEENEEELVELDELKDDSSAKDTSVQKLSFSIPGFIGGIIDTFDGNTKDGQIGNTKQGHTGDCYFLATINAISYTEKGREIIKNALDYQKNGSTVVHFAIGDFTVTQDELNAAKGKFKYSTGDDDMLIFELAMEKAILAIVNNKVEVPEKIKELFSNHTDGNLNGGMSYAVFYILTGEEGDVAAYDDEINDALDYFAKNGNKDFMMTTKITDWSCDGKPVVVQDVNGNKVELAKDHAYSIKSVDLKNDTVTVINPWDSSKEIVLDRKVFMKAFDSLNYVDLSENKDGFNKWVEEQDKNREVINGVRHNFEYDYDAKGNVTRKRVQTRNGSAGLEFIYGKDGSVTVLLFEIRKDGSIVRKNNWTITEEEAENIIKRGILDYPEENTTGAGLANDIFVSGIGKISDEKWSELKDWTLNMKDRIDVQTLAKFASLDMKDLKDAFYLITLNKDLPPSIVYLYKSGIWSEADFQNYLKKHHIKLRRYEDVFGKNK